MFYSRVRVTSNQKMSLTGEQRFSKFKDATNTLCGLLGLPLIPPDGLSSEEEEKAHKKRVNATIEYEFDERRVEEEEVVSSEEEERMAKTSKFTNTDCKIQTELSLSSPSDVYREMKELPSKLKGHIKTVVSDVVHSDLTNRKRITTILFAFRQYKIAKFVKDEDHCDRCCNSKKRTEDVSYEKGIRELGISHPQTKHFRTKTLRDCYDEEKKCYDVVYAWIPSSAAIGEKILTMLYATKNNPQFWQRRYCDCCGVMKISIYDKLIQSLSKLAQGTHESLTGEEENFLCCYIGRQSELFGSKIGYEVRPEVYYDGNRRFSFDPSKPSDSWGFPELDSSAYCRAEIKADEETDRIERKINGLYDPAEGTRGSESEEEEEHSIWNSSSNPLGVQNPFYTGRGKTTGDYGKWFLTKKIVLNPKRNPSESIRYGRSFTNSAVDASVWKISTKSHTLTFPMPQQCCSCPCAGPTIAYPLSTNDNKRKSSAIEEEKEEIEASDERPTKKRRTEEERAEENDSLEQPQELDDTKDLYDVDVVNDETEARYMNTGSISVNDKGETIKGTNK